MSPETTIGIGKTILFIENTNVLAVELYRAMEALGTNVLGPICTTREAALLLASVDIDGAVLDRSLSDSEELIALLQANGVNSVLSCNEPQCQSGRNGCFRLHDVQRDPVTLLKNLFPVVH